MSNYIDGFVLPIPRKHLQDYKQVSEKVARIWKEYGAISYSEFFAEDLHLEGTRSFQEFADANKNEIIVFGWVAFNSKESRDLINKHVASDPRMEDLIAPLTDPSRLIFDASQMFYGGFKALVNS